MKKIFMKYKRFLQRQKIQTALLLYFVVLLLASSVLFFFLTFRYTQKSMVDNSREYTTQLIHQVNNGIDTYMNHMKDISSMVLNSRDIQKLLFQDPQQDVGERERVLAQFGTIMDTRKDIRNIAVIGEDGRIALNKGTSLLNPYASLTEQDWYVRAKETKGTVVLSRPHIQNMVSGKYDWVITLSRGVMDEAEGRVGGVFLIDLNYRTISRLCASVSLGEKGYIYVVDGEGNIIYHPRQQLLYSGLKKEELEVASLSGSRSEASVIRGKGKERKLYTMSTSPNTGWTAIGVAYMSEFRKESRHLQKAYLMMAALMLLLGIALSVVLSKNITRPIVRLDQAMKEVEKGHFKEAVVKTSGQAEVRRLGESFNMMAEEIQKLMAENVKEQAEKRRAEMRALQSQINPHFLYNTLDSIIWMAESGKHNAEVVEMTSALSRLFRQSIGKEEEIVSIADEMEYVRTYLTIQEMRYRNKLTYTIELEEEIGEETIVKLTLQPLVENAIYHGIKYIEGQGKISIRGYYREDAVVLEVADNGIGMDEERIRFLLSQGQEDKDGREESREEKEKDPESRSLRKRKAGLTSFRNTGLGVGNVQRRLQLHYGKDYGLSYVSDPGRGTTVYVRIPILKKEEGEVREENEKEEVE